MIFKPMEQRLKDDCEICNGYGGVYDDDTMDINGLPEMYPCPECEISTLYAQDFFERSFITGRARDGL
jgi:hypothetical protein